jgi:predicted RNA-binding protein with TRAM domain
MMMTTASDVLIPILKIWLTSFLVIRIKGRDINNFLHRGRTDLLKDKNNNNPTTYESGQSSNRWLDPTREREEQEENDERANGNNMPRRFSGPRPFRLSPIQAGQEYDVKIDSMSKRGDSGVTRVQGLVIFVQGTHIGDSVRIRITRIGQGYAIAEKVVDQDSTNKTVPSTTDATAKTDEQE